MPAVADSIENVWLVQADLNGSEGAGLGMSRRRRYHFRNKGWVGLGIRV